MLMPRKVKYRKLQRGRMKGNASRGNKVAFGDFGLQALGRGWMTARQIEAGRVAITRAVKKGGKIWIRVFPWKPITKKPLETRMGKGKGNHEFWVDIIKPGKIIYEIGGVPEEIARRALELASRKLPFKTRIVTRIQ